MTDDPTNPVPVLNAAFTIAVQRDQKAAIGWQVLRLARAAHKVLLATDYMTWAAARMGWRSRRRGRMLAIAPRQTRKVQRVRLWAEANGRGRRSGRQPAPSHRAGEDRDFEN